MGETELHDTDDDAGALNDAEREFEDRLRASRRRSRVALLLLALALGAGVFAWLLAPRAYEGLTLLEPVSEHAYTTGGRPSPGTSAQLTFFEHALPTFFIALDHDEAPQAAAVALEAEVAEAELPAPVLEAVRTFARACADARLSADPALAPPVQRAAANLNQALAHAELGYYVDAQVMARRTGTLRVFAQTFVVEHVGHYQLGPHRERALSIRRLDHTNVAQPTLGFTRPEASEGLVQVDRIEEHLVAHLLPTLAPGVSFRYAEPHVRRSEALTRLEQLAGQVIREELMAALDEAAGATLGTTLHARRALFERWQNLASGREAVFYAPTTYEVDMQQLEPHRWQLDGFQQLREAHRVLGEPAIVSAYLRAHTALVRSVERHELQHRFDYREGVLDTTPAGLAGTLLPLDVGAPLEGDLRVVVAELSAYCAAMADGPVTKTELALLTRHLLGLGGGRRHKARAGGFLLAELDAALAPDGPIVGDRPTHHAARAERLLAVPTERLRSTLRMLWERWFGRALPVMQSASAAAQTH